MLLPPLMQRHSPCPWLLSLWMLWLDSSRTGSLVLRFLLVALPYNGRLMLRALLRWATSGSLQVQEPLLSLYWLLSSVWKPDVAVEQGTPPPHACQTREKCRCCTGCMHGRSHARLLTCRNWKRDYAKRVCRLSSGHVHLSRQHGTWMSQGRMNFWTSRGMQAGPLRARLLAGAAAALRT